MTADVQAVVDRLAIHDLVVRIAIAQDEHDWSTLAQCFEPDATYQHPGGQIVGADAIVARARAALTPLDASQHLVGSILVALDSEDDDRASSTAYFQAQHVRRDADGGELLIIAGTYRDHIRRSDGVWRVAHRQQDYSWRHGNPEVTRRS